MFQAYLNLTKPRISLLFAFTGFVAMFVEGRMNAVYMTAISIAIFVVGGAANAFNQYFERDIDAQMARTAKKRSLPQGKITPQNALAFSIVMSLVGCLMLLMWGGWLAMLLGFLTILYYSFYYTLWLKPRTPYNIVIGGVAGATGPLIGWAAATGSISPIAFVMFLIIVLWTPPHFWALALCCKEDYAKVSYPMLPNVVGDHATRKQILAYTVVLMPIGLLPSLGLGLGLIYLVGSLVLGLLFIVGAISLLRTPSIKKSWQFFAYSIVYLFVLFGLMVADKALSI